MRKLFVTIFISFILVSCENKKISEREDVFYTCSMHPQVISDKPGKCSICGMALTPVSKSSNDTTQDIELNDEQILLGNILVHTIQKGNVDNEIELSGTLSINASQLASVNARVMGRIEKLYVKTTGDYVAKGSPLYDLYSEELNNAKQEYISALERKSLFTDQSLIDFDDLIKGAETKLRVWGMTADQINALKKRRYAPLTTTFYSMESGYVTSLHVTEGGYVMEGGTIVQLANLSTLWAEVQVYTTQLYQIPKGATATILVPGGEKKIIGRIEFANPEVSTESRINLLRVHVPNHENQLRPGMSVIIRVQSANRNSLLLPTDAIILEAKGATAWIQSGKNKFRSQMITTGLESNGMTEVVAGLKQGDAVVVKGAYLLHSEYIFKRGADPMTGHSH